MTEKLERIHRTYCSVKIRSSNICGALPNSDILLSLLCSSSKLRLEDVNYGRRLQAISDHQVVRRMVIFNRLPMPDPST
jgi:hypothetical protein